MPFQSLLVCSLLHLHILNHVGLVSDPRRYGFILEIFCVHILIFGKIFMNAHLKDCRCFPFSSLFFL